VGNTKPKKSGRRAIALDAERLGHVSGAAAALVVLAISLFYQEVDGWTAAVRVAWVFVIAYAIGYACVRWVLRTTLAEYVGQKQTKKAARKVGGNGDAAATAGPVSSETGTP
jgi:hypothetical protein